jgi:hypothetical protein
MYPHSALTPQYPYLLTPPPSIESSPLWSRPDLTTDSIRHDTYNYIPAASSAWTEDIEMAWDGDNVYHLLPRGS